MDTMYKRAMARISSAEYLLANIPENPRCKDIIAFDLQQAIEFLLIQICDSKNKTRANNHDLTHHVNRVINIGDTSTIVKNIGDIASKVYSWEVNSRYSEEFNVDIEDLQSVLIQAKNLADYVNATYISRPILQAYVALIGLADKYKVSMEDISRFYQYLKCKVIVDYSSEVLIEYAIRNIDDLLLTLKDSDFT